MSEEAYYNFDYKRLLRAQFSWCRTRFFSEASGTRAEFYVGC